MQPEQTVVVTTTAKRVPRQRHFLAVFFISFMWGTFGADRFYLGLFWSGLLKLITFGGFGFWVLIDLILVMNGSMRDKQGREMLQFAEYKRFAARTVLIFAVALGLFILINGIVLILGVAQLFTSLQDGSIPGLDALTSGGLDGLSPEQRQELGL